MCTLHMYTDKHQQIISEIMAKSCLLVSPLQNSNMLETMPEGSATLFEEEEASYSNSVSPPGATAKNINIL